MGYYALFYDTVDDFTARRAADRGEHLRLLREAHARGELVLAGALAEPPDRALLVFRSDRRTVAEDFARKDPYVVNGLVRHWEVRPWTVVVGDEPAGQQTPFGGDGRIVRLWSARTGEHEAQPYLDHLQASVIPRIRGLKGYLAATALTRVTDSGVEILVATLWQSLEAIQKFAGPDVARAVVREEAAALLKEFDRRVRHFQVALTDTPASTLAPPSGQS